MENKREAEIFMIQKTIEIQIDNNKEVDYSPTLHTYILENSKEIDPNRKRPAVIICPGGGYTRTSDREAEPVAIQMNAMGFHSFILRYSCSPATFPIPQLELAKAIAIVREHCVEWNIDENKIIVLGFSAGGHLAASMGVFWNREFIYESIGVAPEKIKPSGLILCYPVISSGEFAHRGSFKALLGEKYDELLDFVSLENQIDEQTPPTFIWHTFEDSSVPLENTLLYVNAMRKHKIPMEVHIYPRGRHGLSLANEETQAADGNSSIVAECQNWIQMAGKWIKNF